jgi:transcriptional regulator with XRE-family HTH domain
MIEFIRTHYDIGQTIKYLRKEKRITGTELGRLVKMSQAKISKIENGSTYCSEEEIEALMNILDCPKTIRQQILAVIHLTSKTPANKYRPITSQPDEVYQRELQSHHIRCFLFNLIPAILQVPEYHKALHEYWNVDSAVAVQKMNELVKRQDLIWNVDRTFHFIIAEAALYTLPAAIRVQLAQLDRLDRMNSLPNVRLGIIPVEVGLSTVENTNFLIYDRNTVLFIMNYQELRSTDPRDIAENEKLFDEYSQKAHYGKEAQAIIHKAMNFFQTR